MATPQDNPSYAPKIREVRKEIEWEEVPVPPILEFTCIEQVKMILRVMPYGDFVGMAEAINADPDKMWEYANGD
jgi:hypothetical protein